MKCFFCTNLFSDYLDGILDGGLEKELKAHVLSCRACATELFEFERARKLLKNVGLMDPGEDFYSDVRNYIRGNTWINRSYRRMLVPAAIKVPMILLIVVTIAIIASFVLVERSRYVYLSRVNLEMLPPETLENSLKPEQKDRLRAFSLKITPRIGVDYHEKVEKKPARLAVVDLPTVSPAQGTSEQSKLGEEGRQKVRNSDSPGTQKIDLLDQTLPDHAKNSLKVRKETQKASSSSQTLEQVAALPQKEKNSLLFKIFINSSELVKDTSEILRIVKRHGVEKASNVNLGIMEQDGSYFHMLVPQDDYEKMVEELKVKFKITIVKANSDRIIVNNRYRVIVWVENLKKKAQ